MTTETHSFQAEVSRLLEIVAHSLYSEREVFLRELISNASDALDKLRYETLTTPSLMGPASSSEAAGQQTDSDLKITISYDKSARTLSIADNGIGMSHGELVNNLGTIARSGTSEFIKNMNAAGDKPSLIGQFGMGFYSAFMVADEVQVRSHKAGEDKAWLWISNGKGSFTIEEASDEQTPARGTAIKLIMKEGTDEYLDEARLGTIIKMYSDHIAFPIVIPGEEAGLHKTMNTASALWTRQPKDITSEQYKEFYHHAGHAFDDPWLTIHWHAEGVLDYRALLFVPETKPFDLFDPQRRHHVKLYVRRVFITEAADGLLPPFLRFIRGVVDSEDLPLNVSREMLQNNPVLGKIKTGLTKRVLGDIAKMAQNKPDPSSSEAVGAGYETFWDNFGPVLKEGIYEDKEHQNMLLKLCRFHTTETVTGDGKQIDLDTYIARMKDGQDTIYTISGTDRAVLALSPQLEGFKARGIEVLLLTDPVDDFWQASVEQYGGKKFQSITRGEVNLDKVARTEKKNEPETVDADIEPLIAGMKVALGDVVRDVRVSKRLTSSPVCLVASDNDIDLNLERLLRQHKQLPEGIRRVLEINPQHELIRNLADIARTDAKAGAINDMAWLLLDQARILEGEPLPDPVRFATLMTQMLSKGLIKSAA